jgi:hypothetical protein
MHIRWHAGKFAIYRFLPDDTFDLIDRSCACVPCSLRVVITKIAR